MTTRGAGRPPTKPIPQPDFLTQPFWDGTKAGELRVQRCQSCDTKFFYPRERCPECLSNKLEWVKVSGRGRVYTFTVVRQPGNPAFNDDVPYVFAVIQLDEGPRMNGNVKGIPVEQVKVDMPVEVFFEAASPDVHVAQWRPAK